MAWHKKGNTYSMPSMWDVGVDPEGYFAKRDYVAVATQTNIDNRPLTFGKYRGRTPNEVYKRNPGYILWISKHIPNWTELVTAQLVQHAVNKLAEIEARYEHENSTVGFGPDYQD